MCLKEPVSTATAMVNQVQGFNNSYYGGHDSWSHVVEAAGSVGRHCVSDEAVLHQVNSQGDSVWERRQAGQDRKSGSNAAPGEMYISQIAWCLAIDSITSPTIKK